MRSRAARARIIRRIPRHATGSPVSNRMLRGVALVVLGVLGGGSGTRGQDAAPGPEIAEEAGLARREGRPPSLRPLRDPTGAILTTSTVGSIDTQNPFFL